MFNSISIKDLNRENKLLVVNKSWRQNVCQSRDIAQTVQPISSNRERNSTKSKY